MNKLIIFGRPKCPFCERAVELAKKTGFAYEYRDIMADKSFMQELKSLEPPTRTVPQIYVDSLEHDSYQYIGGYTDFQKRVNEGLTI